MSLAVCKSCGARIIWCKTVNGKSMPVDAKPELAGNIKITPNGVAHVITDLTDHVIIDGQPDLHLSHFATCKNAKQHRKPKGA